MPHELRFFGPLSNPFGTGQKAYSKYPMDPQCLQTRCTKRNASFTKTSLQMMDADLNLITTPKLFLEEEQLPENYRIVGPILLSSVLPCLKKC